MMKKLTSTFALALAAAITLAACNTVEGAGEDMQSAGSAISNAVDGK